MTREVYCKNVVWIEQWKVWRWVFKEVGEKLGKMERERKASSSKGRILRENTYHKLYSACIFTTSGLIITN